MMIYRLSVLLLNLFELTDGRLYRVSGERFRHNTSTSTSTTTVPRAISLIAQPSFYLSSCRPSQL